MSPFSVVLSRLPGGARRCQPRLLRLGRGMIMPPASAEGIGAVRGSCSHVLLLAERLSACGQLAVAVRLIGPASQPAGGAHIRDDAKRWVHVPGRCLCKAQNQKPQGGFPFLTAFDDNSVSRFFGFIKSTFCFFL